MGIERATKPRLSAASVRVVAALGMFSIAGAASALPGGYIGDSYLRVPGVDGSWKGEEYAGAIRVTSHLWQSEKSAGMGGFSAFQAARGAVYSAPSAPRNEQAALVIVLKKNHRDLPALMKMCKQKKTVSEATFVESSERARMTFEYGERPAGIPEYFEYKLKNVQFSDCPVVAKAPEQALILKFSDIEWLNFKGEAKPLPIELKPAKLPPKRQTSGETRQFVVSWLGYAHHVGDDQCPTINDKPPQEAYFKYMSKEEATKVRAELAKSEAGIDYQTGEMGRRGPFKLDVTRLPGVVEDPGHAEPQTSIARGINLDGRNSPEDFEAPDGRKGIDNQLFRVKGCVPGWQGSKGFIVQFVNNQMRDGLFTMLIEVSGIDDERNDDSVDITWLYSKDPMTKDAAGKRILHDTSFRPTDDVQYTRYFKRVPGRIVDGVIESESIDQFRLNMSHYHSPPGELQMSDARIRLEIQPDGTLKGVLAGYRDWRRIASTYASSITESYFGYQMPGLYNSILRHADGMKDPGTGEYHGISSAYDIEAVPAFIVDPDNQLSKMEVKQKQAATGR